MQTEQGQQGALFRRAGFGEPARHLEQEGTEDVEPEPPFVAGLRLDVRPQYLHEPEHRGTAR